MLERLINPLAHPEAVSVSRFERSENQEFKHREKASFRHVRRCTTWGLGASSEFYLAQG